MGQTTGAKVPPLAIFLGAFASFAGFLFGYDTGYISGIKAMDSFVDTFGVDGVLSTGTAALLTSILSVGTFLGAICASVVGDRIGRRFGIEFYLVLFCVGVAMQTAAHDVPVFAVGRVFAGLGVGGTSVLVPVYQSECSPKAIRGFVVSAYQFFVTVGLLVASCVVYATKDFAGRKAFEIPIAVQFAWAAIIGVGTFFLPESPRWLAMKDREDASRKSLSRLIGGAPDSDLVNEQYAEIYANLMAERAYTQSSTWAACFRDGEGHVRRRILTGIVLQALQQFTGINFIFYYGTTFFANSGLSNPFLISTITNVVNVVMTVPGMFAMDRLGRRFLMIYTAIGMGVSQLIVAIVGTVISTDNIVGQRVLIAFVCIFIAHFAAGWGPCAGVITSEMYPAELRAKGMALSTSSQWLWNFAIGYATPYMVDTGPGNAGLGAKVFFIWGGFCVVCTVFSFFCIPETRKLSLEQIDILWRHATPRKSRAYRKYLIEENVTDEITVEGAIKQRSRGTHVEHHPEQQKATPDSHTEDEQFNGRV